MNQADTDYSTLQITPQLISQIVDALKNKAFGSIEIYIENYTVMQITERTITKLAKKVQPQGKFSITVTRTPRPAQSQQFSANRQPVE